MSKFGWDLPPGCSMRDIEQAAGGDEPSPESEHVLELLESVEFTREEQEAVDKVVMYVDDLARDRAYASTLLEQAFNRMPPDPVLTCTCTPKEEYSWCELHEGTGEPTLRQEIDTYLKGSKT